MPADQSSIIILDDDEYSLENLHLSTKSFVTKVDLCSTYSQALKKIKSNHYQVAIVDIKLPRNSGLDFIQAIREVSCDTKCIIVTGYADEDSILKALKLGVDDVLKKPYDEKELKHCIQNLLKAYMLEKENRLLKDRFEKENKNLRKQLSDVFTNGNFQIIGASKQLLTLIKSAEKIGQYSLNTLIAGETGVGKSLLARYIHFSGKRRNGPFVSLNCSELSPSLIESELFGFTKGAFTNATVERSGLIESANNGILFLDEIFELPNNLQAKLLNVLENNLVRRIGSNDWLKVDVQIIAATNQNIANALESKQIRKDLYHRLSEKVLQIPPLRERKDDIPLLLNYFIKKNERFYGKKAPTIDGHILQDLKVYNWPGNVRQLSNFAKNWCLFASDFENETEFYQNWIENGYSQDETNGLTYNFSASTMSDLNEAKQWLIRQTVKHFNGNKSQAAKHLGMSYVALLNNLKNKGNGKS